MSVSFSEKPLNPLEFLSRSLGQGIGGGLQARNALNLESEKMTLTDRLQTAQQERKNQAELKQLEESFPILEEKFGPDFAKLFKALPTGGKTELLKHGLDTLARNEDLEELITGGRKGQESTLEKAESERVPEKVPQLENGELPKGYELPDFTKRPKGYTPKEWADERKTWRKENLPAYQENQKRINAHARDELGVRTLQKLNDTRKVGEGFERLLINPNSGDFYGLAQLSGVVSPEAQQWVKEIARFGNRAKDAFGSRVTNFDLQQYLKQFPGLLNTHEGRNRILKMMEINLNLDNLYDKALQKIYAKKGLSGIPIEEADKLAREFIEEDTEKLRNDYVNLDIENESSSPQQNGGNRPSLGEIFG